MNRSYFIGCSGYHYDLWKGEFYPAELPKSKWLPYYTQSFNTVEINSSFYKSPTLQSLKPWYNKTPPDYQMAIKANRVITHYRRFNNVEEQVRDFYQIAQEGLQEKLGPVLFQCPPTFYYDPVRLDNLLRHMDPRFQNVVEFRHSSWWRPEVYEQLQKHKVAFCSVSLPYLPEEVIKTSPLGYIRMHGNVELFKSTYTLDEIKRWAEDIQDAEFEQVYIFFNNTWYNGAVKNAQQMRNLVDS